MPDLSAVGRWLRAVSGTALAPDLSAVGRWLRAVTGTALVPGYCGGMPARRLAAVMLLSLVAAGPVARVGDATITQGELAEPLIDAHGLDMLLALAQLKAAEQEARKAGVEVTDRDVADERQVTIDYFATQIQNAGDDDPADLLRQFLRQQQISQAEFDLAMKTNAHLRKLVAADVRDQITPEILERAFNLQYGEKVQVRHIAVPNLEMVQQVQDRLAGGEDFAAVARDMSVFTQTAAVGGEVPPFSRQQQGLPTAFKDVAFALETPGQVSDPVQADGSYHLIQFVRRIAPQAVKFEDVKAGLRDELAEGFARAEMDRKRAEVQARVAEQIEIDDPELRAQFEAAKAAATPQPMDRGEQEERFRKLREQGNGGGGDE